MHRRRSTPRAVAAALAALWLGVGAIVPARAAGGLANELLLRGLSAAQQAAIARNGFVVTAPVDVAITPALENQIESPAAHTPKGELGLQHAMYWQFSDLYSDNYRYRMPSFITTDALLHTFHAIYDDTLMALERTLFAGELATLSGGMMDAATYQYGATTDARIKDAARLNLGYTAVAARLLNPAAKTPPLVAPLVDAELALIAAHRGIARSPLLGQPIDYSQFVPRGHYTGSAALRRYFLAMTWYGQVQFPLAGPDAALRTRQALLLVRGLTLIPDLNRAWSAVFDPITQWVGQSDDLTARQYQRIMATVYGANAPVGALADDAKLARFIALAKALPGPQIRGAGGTTPGFRLFGQRFVPDAAIMQALIYPQVGTAQQPRRWPMGLDVAATLGSQRAAALLTGPLGQGAYANYGARLAAQQRQFGSLPASTWSGNLYWSWLNALRAEWGSPAPGAPPFMQTAAWSEKDLAAGLGSWAELRHDTLLYVKQPYGLGAGGAPPLAVAYVEPAPTVYARLLALVRQMKATLARAGVLDRMSQQPEQFYTGAFTGMIPNGETGYRAAIDAFAGIVALCNTVAQRELSNQTIASADLNTLTSIGALLDILTTFFDDNANGRDMIPFDRQVAEIADVFTEPTSGQVLEEGVGDVLPIYAVVTVNGTRWLARGGVYSYYEFHQPMSDRLTDDAWRHMGHRPGLPSWTAGYMAG